MITAFTRKRTLVAVRCPRCEEQFPLKRRGDLTTYPIAQYTEHLRLVHGIFLPKPLEVTE